MEKTDEHGDRGILVYVTTPDEATAVRIARDVLQRRLAACANIVPAVRSLYWWEGALQEDKEALLFLKSRAALAEPLREAIAALHPYSVPAITVVPVERMHPPYWAWLMAETGAR